MCHLQGLKLLSPEALPLSMTWSDLNLGGTSRLHVDSSLHGPLPCKVLRIVSYDSFDVKMTILHTITLTKVYF